MRAEFIEGCKTARDAAQRAPWAIIISKVGRGFVAFESIASFYLWHENAVTEKGRITATLPEPA